LRCSRCRVVESKTLDNLNVGGFVLLDSRELALVSRELALVSRELALRAQG